MVNNPKFKLFDKVYIMARDSSYKQITGIYTITNSMCYLYYLDNGLDGYCEIDLYENRADIKDLLIEEERLTYEKRIKDIEERYGD